MSDRVDIVLPTGERATVPDEDLEQALAAGAVRDPGVSHRGIDLGPLGLIPGSAASDFVADKAESTLARVSGAASAATIGLSDVALSEGSYILGGDKLQHDTMQAVKTAKEAHPYQYMAGEAAGLMLGPVGEIGEAVQTATAARTGGGLVGSMAEMGARGLVEGGAMGVQHQITEDKLEGHDLIGQQLFTGALKDGLIGGAVGVPMGAGGYYLGKAASSLVTRLRGPVGDVALDEAVGGVEGAGRLLREDARASEATVEALRKAGMTSDQAVQTVSEIQTMSRAGGPMKEGPLSGIADDLSAQYAARRAGGNGEMAEVIARDYAERTGRIAKHETTLDLAAQKMARTGTKVLRLAEDTANEVAFTYKPQQFAKLVDGARLDLQRDMVAGLLQESDEMLRFWESTAAKGGAEGAIKSLRKVHTDAARFMSSISPDSTTAGAELYIRADKFKRAMDRYAQWGKQFGLPEAVMHDTGIRPIADKWRAALEDEAVWGLAGPAQSEWNASFSNMKARRDHFGDALGVAIDQQRGVSLPEVDFKKVRGMLTELRGNDIDLDLQAVKSTQAFIDGIDNRVQKILSHGDLTEAQRTRLTQGLAELSEFKATFQETRKEAAAINAVKAQQLEEQGRGMGGLFGLVTDSVTRPLTTMQRLAEIRNTARTVEKAIERGFAKAFRSGGEVVADEAPRAKEVVAKEIAEVRELVASPGRIQDRVSRWMGDLPKHAPGIAREVEATAVRALVYLAQEAPKPTASSTFGQPRTARLRYSDQEISVWENKRRAVLGASSGKLGPETLIGELQKGKLNRDAIQAVEQVSPRLFGQMQDMARAHLEDLERRGLLDKMPYQRKAAIAALLKITPDGTYQPDFIGLMQAAKAMPAPEPAPAPGAPMNGPSKRAIKMNPSIFATETGRIEGLVQ